jgi:mono/diheme cytochrome c family protein
MNKKITKVISLMAVFSCVAIAITSCGKHDANSPGVEFMPDMYRSPSLESNMAYVKIENGKETGDTMMANRMPVAGTIPRGYMPYAFPNTPEGNEAAKTGAHNPFERNEANLKQGEELYGKFCVHCHGATGMGDGAVGLKLPGAPPAYTAPDKINMTEGEIFQIITYGKGLMGPHAPLVNQEERWKLVLYVQKLQHPNGVSAAPAADSTATAAAPKEEAKKK